MTRIIPVSVTKCPDCRKRISNTAWEFCPWCGVNVKNPVEIEEPVTEPHPLVISDVHQQLQKSIERVASGKLFDKEHAAAYFISLKERA